MESSQITINPFLLTFSDTTLEERYDKQQHKNSCFTDRWFCIINLSTFPIFICIQWFSQCDKTGILIAIASVLSFAFQMMFMTLRRRHWIHNRFCYVCFLRCLRFTFALFGLQHWMRAPGIQPSPFKSLVVGSGSLINFWDALGYSMLFRYYLAMQVPLSVLMLYFTAWPQCSDFLNNPSVLEAIRNIKKSVTLFQILSF